MSAYGGVLSSEHLRAAIRTGLHAHGFAFSRAEYDAAVERGAAAAAPLREALAAGHEDVRERDPYLWGRLPLMATLGVEQARALRARAFGDEAAEAADLGGTFNAAIAVLDYLVDERAEGERLFSILDETVAREIFADPLAAARTLRAIDVADPSLRLLLELVASCAERGGRLLERHGRRAVWDELGRLVERMLVAEREVSLEAEPSEAAMTAKSTLPSEATLLIVALAGDGDVPPQARETAARLGRLFSLVDDLADLLDDATRGVPTPLVRRLRERASAGGRDAAAADGDLYDVIDEASAEIAALVADLGPDDELQAFARLVTAGWSGWHEEGPPAEVPLPLAVAPGESGAVDAALAFLLESADDGWAEAQHHLWFPRLGPDGSPVYETHPAVVPFRAVGLDALLDARDAGVPVPEPVLHREAMALLRDKHRDVRGGWTYLPQVPELPPDADDVGQVLQALVRLGGRALAATCEEPARLAVDATDPTGGFPTWIMDPRGRSEADARVRAYAPIMGGAGVHAEVVANLLYGLLLYDPARYAGPLRAGAAYLEQVQDPGGWWESKWYAGPYYGTFKALYLLDALAAGDRARERARDFLLGGQQPDGGWGDPLATALSLLALHAPGAVADPAVTERAVARLLADQDADGAWPAVPWIVFPTTDGEVSYGSRTMTTAFCLKALLATGVRAPAARALEAAR